MLQSSSGQKIEGERSMKTKVFSQNVSKVFYLQKLVSLFSVYAGVN